MTPPETLAPGTWRCENCGQNNGERAVLCVVCQKSKPWSDVQRRARGDASSERGASGPPVTLADVVEEFGRRLGVPTTTATDTRSAMWGAPGAETPTDLVEVVGYAGGLVTVSISPLGAPMVFLYVAESFADLAGAILGGTCPRPGMVVPLHVAAQCAVRVMRGR